MSRVKRNGNDFRKKIVSKIKLGDFWLTEDEQLAEIVQIFSGSFDVVINNTVWIYNEKTMNRSRKYVDANLKLVKRVNKKEHPEYFL